LLKNSEGSGFPLKNGGPKNIVVILKKIYIIIYINTVVHIYTFIVLNFYWITFYDSKNNTLHDSIIIVFKTSPAISSCPGAINIDINWKVKKVSFLKN
jgi:hypothetical protein